jgi:hypothetical protein
METAVDEQITTTMKEWPEGKEIPIEDLITPLIPVVHFAYKDERMADG